VGTCSNRTPTEPRLGQVVADRTNTHAYLCLLPSDWLRPPQRLLPPAFPAACGSHGEASGELERARTHTDDDADVQPSRCVRVPACKGQAQRCTARSYLALRQRAERVGGWEHAEIGRRPSPYSVRWLLRGRIPMRISICCHCTGHARLIDCCRRLFPQLAAHMGRHQGSWNGRAPTPTMTQMSNRHGACVCSPAKAKLSAARLAHIWRWDSVLRG